MTCNLLRQLALQEVRDLLHYNFTRQILCFVAYAYCTFLHLKYATVILDLYA